MSTTRAKFRVEEVGQNMSGHYVNLRPVTGGSPENEQFYKYTPCGEIKLGTINAEAAANFAPGKQFYVDFTPAE